MNVGERMQAAVGHLAHLSEGRARMESCLEHQQRALEQLRHAVSELNAAGEARFAVKASNICHMVAQLSLPATEAELDIVEAAVKELEREMASLSR